MKFHFGWNAPFRHWQLRYPYQTYALVFKIDPLIQSSLRHYEVTRRVYSSARHLVKINGMETEKPNLNHNHVQPRLSPATTDRPWRALWDWLLAPIEIEGESTSILQQAVQPTTPADEQLFTQLRK